MIVHLDILIPLLVIILFVDVAQVSEWIWCIHVYLIDFILKINKLLNKKLKKNKID